MVETSTYKVERYHPTNYYYSHYVYISTYLPLHSLFFLPFNTPFSQDFLLINSQLPKSNLQLAVDLTTERPIYSLNWFVMKNVKWYSSHGPPQNFGKVPFLSHPLSPWPSKLVKSKIFWICTRSISFEINFYADWKLQ